MLDYLVDKLVKRLHDIVETVLEEGLPDSMRGPGCIFHLFALVPQAVRKGEGKISRTSKAVFGTSSVSSAV